MFSREEKLIDPPLLAVFYLPIKVLGRKETGGDVSFGMEGFGERVSSRVRWKKKKKEERRNCGSGILSQLNFEKIYFSSPLLFCDFSRMKDDLTGSARLRETIAVGFFN